MIDQVLQDAETRMEKTIEVLISDLASVRAGKASVSLLDKIVVDYYGAPTPLNQLASISAPEPRLLVVQPWDKTAIQAIEKAILKSDLGLNPGNDGNIIRINIPQLTQERRKELVKVIKKRAEEARVAVRNIRRDINDNLKNLEKNKEVSEDESKKGLDKAQKITDKFIVEVDNVYNKKEKEIMEV